MTHIENENENYAENENDAENEKGDAILRNITACFSETVMNLLEDQNTDIYLREHYSESPNYYANDKSSIAEMLETMLWLTKFSVQKREILDRELAEYMAIPKAL